MPVFLAALLIVGAAVSPSAFGPAARAQQAGSGDPSPLVEDFRFGAFTSAEALSVDVFGNVFVLDAGASVLRKFDASGRALAEVGGPGWDSQQFDRPTGVDARTGIAVYVADMGNSRVTRFDRDLGFMATLRGDDGGIDPGFAYPVDVAQSPLEQLFILDGENSRVLALRGFNTVERVFGGIESGAGRLQDPVALATDGGTLLYVLESDRVVVFDYFGNYLRQFGRGRVQDAQGIAVLPQGLLVVTPETLHLFAPDGEHRRDIGRADLVLAAPAEEFRDAAATPKHFILLTTHHCILFPAGALAKGS